eukprot:s2721_g7.t1
MGLGCSVDVARAAVCESCNCVDDSFEDDTPRGPTPPWAVHNTECEPVDKTSTGATPPRMLVAIRCSPPGLPEDLDQSHNQPGLLVALGAGFCRDLFRAARTGNDALLEKLIKNAYTSSCVHRGGSGDLDDGTAEDTDTCCSPLSDFQAVSSILSFARDVGTGETLLGAAAKHGEALVVRLLLLNSANPTISDSRGRMALHRAAEGGDLLTTLLVLDRLQSADRFLSDFVDNHGETPGVVASSAGSSAVCGALEIFGDMQLNAEQQYVGQLGKPGVRNDILSSLDFGSEAAASLQYLREASLGSALVPKIWPQTQAGFDLADALNQAFQGLQQAEDLLMNGSWKPRLKQVVRTIDLRVRWQRLRTDAMAGTSAKVLEEFWQTHMSAARMAKLTRGEGSQWRSVVILNFVLDEGNLQQIYLGILWLFTRESWLPHIMEALAGFLRESCTEVWMLPVLLETLHTIIWQCDRQLVQAATCYFRQQGVRHEGITFRPVVLPASVLKSMIDRFLLCKEERQLQARELPWLTIYHSAFAGKATDPVDAEGLETGMWFVLSHGSFPTAFASRWDAGKRLASPPASTQGVLLAIQADPKFPSFPEHMSLKGGGDDVPRSQKPDEILSFMTLICLDVARAQHGGPQPDPSLKRHNASLRRCRAAAMSRVYLEQRDANHVPPPQTAAEVSAAVEAAAEAVANCDVLIFTAGAGMGVDCGLPDFRGSSGLFKDREVAMTYEEMSDDKWFAEDPLFAWGINYTQLSMYRHTQPHEGIGGEIKLFPLPTYHGELDKWDDWSWQLKRYVGLYKPLAKTLMDEIELNAQKVVTDGLCEAYDVQQTSTQNNQLSLLSKQLAYMLAQITDGAARAIVRNEDTENGFEIWRRLYNQFSRSDHLESDLSDFIILKNRHEKTTGVPLDNDLLITLIMQKTTGPLQQHLRLNVRNITTFTEALEIVYSYIKSRHLVEEGQQEGNQEDWSQDAEWYGDEWSSWDVYDWSQDWIGSLDDWSGDWSWSEDDWSYWSDDWSWDASASSGSQSTANVPVENQDLNATRPSRTVRGAKPGMMTNLFVGACLLIGALSAGVPPVPSRNVPENDQLGCDDRLVGFHMQAGLVDKSWILFGSGACANCCSEWFAPDYPVLPLSESAPSLRSLSGKTLDVQGRKIVQLATR